MAFRSAKMRSFGERARSRSERPREARHAQSAASVLAESAAHTMRAATTGQRDAFAWGVPSVQRIARLAADRRRALAHVNVWRQVALCGARPAREKGEMSFGGERRNINSGQGVTPIIARCATGNGANDR